MRDDLPLQAVGDLVDTEPATARGRTEARSNPRACCQNDLRCGKMSLARVAVRFFSESPHSPLLGVCRPGRLEMEAGRSRLPLRNNVVLEPEQSAIWFDYIL